jgi:ribosomal protein S18 acetylase RimI-like enzyme
MNDETLSKRLLYRSSLSGEPLTLPKAHLAVVAAGDIPKHPPFKGKVRLADLQNALDLKAVESINNVYWGTMMQDVFGREYSVYDCDSLVAVPLPDERDATDPACHGIAGNVAIFEENEGFLHIVVFHVWPQWHGRGVGKKLLATAVEQAKKRGFPTIKLGTTNDNLPALYFYQRSGFVMEKLMPYDLTEENDIFPGGFAGITVRSELIMRLDI